MDQVLLAVLVTLLLCVAIGMLVFGFYRAIAIARTLVTALQELSSGLHISEATMKSLAEAARKYQDSATAIESLPRLVQGFTQIATTGVDQITRLERTVQALKASLIGGTEVSSSDVQVANTEYEIAQMMADRGMSREAAEREINERELFKRLRF